MRFSPPLIPGRLLRRYKRFLADVRLDCGEEVVAHCANPGSMLGLIAPHSRIFLSCANEPRRKLRFSWEISEADFGSGPQFVGINTWHPNSLVAEAIGDGTITELRGYDSLRREVTYGKNSRIDILLEHFGRRTCFVEVKNVHMMRRSPLAEFPDCVTARGAKHLEELGDMVVSGHRATLVYLIQMAAERFELARDIDPVYAAASTRAVRRGVEVIAYACRVTPEAIVVEKPVPIAST